MMYIGAFESPLPRRAPAKVKMEDAGAAKIMSEAAIMPVISTVRPMISQVPLVARFSSFAPTFWLTKVVDALAKLFIGKNTN